MIILHKDGTLVELSLVEKVRPLAINGITGRRNVELRFTSGITDIYEDFWHSKAKEGCSIYELMLSEKFPVDWRGAIKT